MKNIAILTGGFDAEKIISFRSADVVEKFLPKTKYHVLQIIIETDGWYEKHTKSPIDKNDFTLILDGKKHKFDAVFAALHGSPLEDGKLQGYFDILQIPYTCCSGWVSALTMNKMGTKKYLSDANVHMSKTLHFRRNQPINFEAIRALGLPLFVKPNAAGSSFGITKVHILDGLQRAIDIAFEHDEEILVEEFIEGREFGNGVFSYKGIPTALPITEIISETEFFDYAAKYEGKSKEVTPANLSPELTKKCQNLSLYLYKELECSGFVRFDYILKGEEFYFLEVNTIPGMSEQSIIPQQATHFGMSLTDFFDIALQEILEFSKK
ncbi:MAG: D-alanine--D-alanine ligase [Chitinophagales bacterium]|nr:D-alanine--D-alanine ligase [Chitinophagales bacterium]